MQTKVKHSSVMEPCKSCNKGISGKNIIWADQTYTHICEDCIEDLKKLL